MTGFPLAEFREFVHLRECKLSETDSSSLLICFARVKITQNHGQTRYTFLIFLHQYILLFQ